MRKGWPAAAGAVSWVQSRPSTSSISGFIRTGIRESASLALQTIDRMGAEGQALIEGRGSFKRRTGS